MKRLLILPAVAVLCIAEAWRKGLVWPVATQTWSIIAPRVTAYDEDDVIA